MFRSRCIDALKRMRLPVVDLSAAPRDRILSAISTDGISWTREPGVRHDVGGMHGNEMVYYCHVEAVGNGQLRMYYYGSIHPGGAWRGRILSAISSDGLEWRDEPGVRVDFGGEQDAHHACAPSLVRLTATCWRMYYSGTDEQGTGCILSAVSSDGLLWRKESGVRLDSSAFGGASSLLDGFVVPRAGGGYRLYVSASSGPRVSIHSASSEDGLHWEAEVGARIECGSPGRRLVANNPCVVRTPAGLRMYFRGGDELALDNRIHWAISSDGLDWQVVGVALAPRADHPFERHAVAFPFVHALPDGRWRMYYTGYWGRFWRERRVLARWRQATAEALSAPREHTSGNERI